MKKLIAVLAAAIGLSVVGMAPAGAAGQVCYDVNVAAAGSTVVAQAGCQDLP